MGACASHIGGIKQRDMPARMSQQYYDAVLPAPFGAVGVRVDGDFVAGVDILQPGIALQAPADPVSKDVARQFAQYLIQPDFRFQLPLSVAGTAFQRKVWAQIAAIPSGQTTSYGKIADRIASAPRAVGQACGANPHPIITPCHRVLAARGGLGGFSGRAAEADFLLWVKRWLLSHEGARFQDEG